MTTLILLSLRLLNFKGARDFTLNAQGHDVSVFGDNGLGKTTIADAWFWLLFGKDSLNRADFEIKTVENGRTMHNAEHTVEAELDTPFGRLTLKRVYKEDWVKVRGRANKEFQGHETLYYVNGVPVKKKDYEARVAEVCHAKTFRLLTDPFCFNDDKAFPWQERRRMLLELCGDVTTEEVIGASRKLAELPAILGRNSIDDHRKILVERQRDINKELDAIPGRIDEARRLMPERPAPLDEEQESALRAQLEDLRGTKATVTSGGAVAEKTVRLREIEGEMIAIANRLRGQTDPARSEALSLAQAKGRELEEARTLVVQTESRLRAVENELGPLNSRRNTLLSQHGAESKKVYPGGNVCPSCKQPLPEEEVAAAVAAFNQAKAHRLAEIVEEGKSVRSKIDDANRRVEALRAEVEGAKARVESINAERVAIVVPEAVAIDFTADPDYQAKVTDKAAVEAEIAQVRADASSVVAGMEGEIRDLEEQLRSFEQARSAIARRQEVETRIAELEKREKTLGQEFEKASAEIFLIEEFVRQKSSLLTQRINARFSVARFRLFEDQINGGLQECCEATVDGVPFGSLNHAMRVNVGLDIIDAFAEKHGFAPPIFVDGAESVTRIRATVGQQIRLVVSDADKALRVETQPRGMAVAPTAPAPETLSSDAPERELAETLF